MQADFESGEVRRLVGIKDFYLNKFIERKQFGLKPSVRAGEKWGVRRRFSPDDVLDVALIWWLYEAGLRTPVIQYVLNQICKRLNAKASEARRIVVERGTAFLVIRREPRSYGKQVADRPEQKVEFANQSRALRIVTETATGSVLAIPIGNLFSHLKEMMRTL